MKVTLHHRYAVIHIKKKMIISNNNKQIIVENYIHITRLMFNVRYGFDTILSILSVIICELNDT